ncbi:NAD(P)H-dependent oxidoreductase [bacterium]|nr:NAD(P)H-dependent oxidoreductase [bacterium]
MKKITAFVGSARKQHTHHAVRQLFTNLQALGDLQCEIVALSDYALGTCRGCKLCFDKSEELCPLKDDRDALIAKIMASDGVVFASPNYSFQVSAIMKIFLDRLGFVFHRPRFFGRLMKPAFPVPSLMDLIMFRMSRTSIRLMLEGNPDYTYYKEKGWFESEFYYPVRLGMFKKAAGRLFDSVAAIVVRRR